MRRECIALLALLLAAAPQSILAQTSATPPKEILALAQRIIDAANANDTSKLSGIYTDDAVVIDEVSPFRWAGADAGVKWWQHVAKSLEPRHATLRATVYPPTEYQADREKDDAYLIQPLKITVTAGGKTTDEQGIQTYTFHKGEDGTWKISSATWTTKPR